MKVVSFNYLINALNGDGYQLKCGRSLYSKAIRHASATRPAIQDYIRHTSLEVFAMSENAGGGGASFSDSGDEYACAADMMTAAIDK